MGNVVANLIVDEALDDVFLVCPHDDAAHMRVIGFGKEISWIRRVAAVFQGYQVVLLIAGHVVGMSHAPGGIDLSRVGIDEFCPALMDSVPVLPKLFPFQLACVCRWRPNLLCAPLAGTDVVLDVVLRDIRVRCPWSPNRVRINPRRANPVGWRRSTM